MKEYIEREAIKSGMIRYGFTAPDMTVTEFVEDELPAADVVDVVRCRDCAKREICRTSNTWAVAPSDDWFCADGERKGGDE